jgi:hypothetical protein
MQLTAVPDVRNYDLPTFTLHTFLVIKAKIVEEREREEIFCNFTGAMLQ